jgi:formate-dependent nitrite reductase membrane component NrfD
MDLGRLDRLVLLMLSPSLSAITVGAYALFASIACASFFSVARLSDTFLPPRPLVRGISLLGFVAGLATAAYTGFLLMDMSSILFWQSLLLPIVFILSSVSMGSALLFLCLSFVEARRPLFGTARSLARVDTALILAELLCLTLYLAQAALDPETTGTARGLLSGSMGWLFWGGAVLCGCVAPVLIEGKVSARSYRVQILWVALLVLIGGLTLRYCVIASAAFDVTQMPGLVYQLSGT